MDWARILAYVTGTVDQELLARKEYLAAEKDARARRRLNRRSSIRLSVPTRKRSPYVRCWRKLQHHCCYHRFARS
jgi:hypothetical protein